MKRFPSFLCFLMAAAISASLTGCGGSPGAGSSARDSRLTRLPRALSRRPVPRRLTPPGRRIIMCLERALPELCRRESPPPCPADQNRGRTSPNSPEDKPAHVGESGESSYDFSQPAPESPAVDNTYFEDAAFVGDSRTDGFLLYSGIGTGTNLTSNGLSIFKLAEKKGDHD